MSSRGRLIAFEGIDGAGKSTQIRRLHQRIAAAGRPCVATREPTDGPWGEKIRRSAQSERMSPADELAAFVSDRRQHVEEVIAPALDAGQVVLIDRYFYSTAAYQGARGLAVADVLAANAFAPVPDLLFVFDLPPELGLERVHGRGAGADLFENVDELRRVREIFLSLEAPAKIVLDATVDPDELTAAIWDRVEPLIR
jgi:dTMP kinase